MKSGRVGISSLHKVDHVFVWMSSECQLVRAWQRVLVIFRSFLGWWACLETNAMSGESKPLLFGMPNAACINLPWSFCRCLTGRNLCLMMAERSLQRRLCLSVGRVIDHETPSMVHPRISLVVSQHPSPLRSFFKAMGSSSVLFVTDAGGKTWWIPWRMAWVKCSNCLGDCTWASPRKSSTYTLRSFRDSLVGKSRVFGKEHDVGRHRSSRGCGGRDLKCY